MIYFFLGTRISLDTLKRRLDPGGPKLNEEVLLKTTKPPFFETDIILSIPNITLKPSLENLQRGLSKVLQIAANIVENMPQWNHWKQRLGNWELEQ